MSLREAILSSGHDLAVEVNQRALIDKVLARYSGAFTVYRELLQNANDAHAACVEVHFKSNVNDPSAPFDLRTDLIHSITVRNDGQVFDTRDWERLRKIAEGNPDEEKIGAYGVGFYSLFSLAEEPLVSSGDQVMLFHWKGSDQLYVRIAPFKSDERSPSGQPWTTFEINLREAQTMPDPEEFCRFMAASLAFTKFLSAVRIYFNDTCICSLQKKQAPSSPIRPNTALQLQSRPKKMFNLRSIDLSPVQMDAKVLSACLPQIKPKLTLLDNVSSATRLLTRTAFSAFSSSPVPTPAPETKNDPMSIVEASIFVRVVTAQLSVSLSSRDAAEIERALKKSPPKQTTMQMIYAPLGEYKATHSSDSGLSASQRIFADLTGSLDKQGRVAIGFFTHQSTGNGTCMEARLIPTVERESLDFVNAHVADFNKELVWMAGLTARIIYDEELRLMAKGDTDPANPGSSIEEFVHLAKFFAYRDSTPSSVVGSISKNAFFQSATNKDILVRSTKGLLPASKVRLPSPELFFLGGIATLPEEVMLCQHFVSAIREYNLVKEVDLNDIYRELASNALSEADMQACLAWWIDLASNRSYQAQMRNQFLNAGMLSVQLPQSKGRPAQEVILPLYSLRHFIGPRSILPAAVLPHDCLPYSVSKSFRHADLTRVFGWTELTTAQELRYLLSPAMTTNASANIETNILQSPHFADQILQNLAKAWSNITAQTQSEVCAVLAEHPIIPTRQGPKKAKEAYFANVDLFPDLAIISFPSNAPIRGNLEKILEQAGVLRHVDLQMVFSRLVDKGDRPYTDVLKYLVSVQSTLKSEEMDKLRQTAWLPAEDANDTTKYNASQLHEPSTAILQIGLKVLRLEKGAKWSTHSAEARFLFSIGLRRFPTAKVLLNAASSSNHNGPQRQAALEYFLTNHAARYADWPSDLASIPFVPCHGTPGEVLCAPNACYQDPLASLLGFPVVATRLQADSPKFRLQRNPSVSLVLQKIFRSPPAKYEDAVAIFGYLSTRVVDFSKADLQALGAAPVIPLIKKKDSNSSITYVTPLTCYFAKPQSNQVFAAIFNFVDFGPNAKPFLTACGVKEEPSTLEVSQMVTSDPARILQLAGSFEAYCEILRPIATGYKHFPAAVVKGMRDRPFLPAITRRVLKTARKEKEETEDDDIHEEIWMLKPAGHCVVVDDVVLARLFAADIHSIPQEDLLESFAEDLGSPRLSRVVKTTQQPSNPMPPGRRADELRSLILERSTLFLHEREGSKKEVIRSADWLKTNLKIVEVGKLEQHHTLHLGSTKRITVPVSAAVVKGRADDVVLYVVLADIDFFEVSSSLCTILLAKQNINDSLLFLTILTTPLKTLQKRGFDTTRIFKARETERRAAELRQKEAEVQKQIDVAARGQILATIMPQLQARFPHHSPEYLQSILDSQKSPSLEAAAQQILHEQQKTEQQKQVAKPPIPQISGAPTESTGSGFLSNWRRKFTARGGFLQEPEQAPLLQSADKPAPTQPQANTSTASLTQTKPPVSDHATPLADIQRNVLSAIQASKPDQANSVKDISRVTEVKESTATYCDSSAGMNLAYVADVSRLRFFISRDVRNVEAFLLQHGESLSRLIELVLHPLSNIFRLDPKALHVFYDTIGPLIAFNRNGSLFINLRFFLEWHDKQVQEGQLEEALISNFFSLAHEIAHNLVSAHNSEHEFYMNAICEMHFTALASYLGSLHNK